MHATQTAMLLSSLLIAISFVPSVHAFDDVVIYEDGTIRFPEMVVTATTESHSDIFEVIDTTDDLSMATYFDAVDNALNNGLWDDFQKNCFKFTGMSNCGLGKSNWDYEELTGIYDIRDTYQKILDSEKQLVDAIELLEKHEQMINDPNLKIQRNGDFLTVWQSVTQALDAQFVYEKNLAKINKMFQVYDLKREGYQWLKTNNYLDKKGWLDTQQSKSTIDNLHAQVNQVRNDVSSYKQNPVKEYVNIDSLMKFKLNLTILTPDDGEQYDDPLSDENFEKALQSEKAGGFFGMALKENLEILKVTAMGNVFFGKVDSVLNVFDDVIEGVKVEKNELTKAVKEYIALFDQKIETQWEYKNSLEELNWLYQITETFIEDKEFVRDMLDRQHIHLIQLEQYKGLGEEVLQDLEQGDTIDPVKVKEALSYESFTVDQWSQYDNAIRQCDVQYLTNVGAFAEILKCGDISDYDVKYANIKMKNISSDDSDLTPQAKKFFLALEHIEAERYEDAINILGDKKSFEPDLNLARAYQLNGNYVNAAYVFSLFPDNIDANNGFAYNNFSVGNYQTAINFYEESIKMDENHIDAYNGLGMVYRSLEDHDAAEFYYNRALSLNHENMETLEGLQLLRGN